MVREVRTLQDHLQSTLFYLRWPCVKALTLMENKITGEIAHLFFDYVTNTSSSSVPGPLRRKISALTVMQSNLNVKSDDLVDECIFDLNNKQLYSDFTQSDLVVDWVSRFMTCEFPDYYNEVRKRPLFDNLIVNELFDLLEDDNMKAISHYGRFVFAISTLKDERDAKNAELLSRSRFTENAQYMFELNSQSGDFVDIDLNTLDITDDMKKEAKATSVKQVKHKPNIPVSNVGSMDECRKLHDGRQADGVMIFENVANHERFKKRIRQIQKEARADAPPKYKYKREQARAAKQAMRMAFWAEPQAGSWMPTFNVQHDVGDDVKAILADFSSRISELSTTVGGYTAEETVAPFRQVATNFSNMLERSSSVIDQLSHWLKNIMICLPVSVAAFLLIRQFDYSVAVKMVPIFGMVLSGFFSREIWEVLSPIWHNIFSCESQAGSVDVSMFSNFIVSMMMLLTCGSAAKEFDFRQLTQSIGTFGQKADGFTRFTDFVLGIVEKIVNYVRNAFGKDNVRLVKVGVKAVDSWCDKVMDIMTMSNTGVDIMQPTVIEDIMALRREGRDLTNMYRFSATCNATLHRYLGFLDNLCVMCSSAMHSFKGGRPQPVVLCLSGKPGVGKTYLSKLITSMVLSGIFDKERAEKLEYNFDSEVFQKGPTEYWNGYAGQASVIVDDWGQSVPDSGSDNDFIDVIRMANCWSYPLNFADLENKGKNFFRSDFILLTTNLKNLNNAQTVIAEPEAVTRRLDFCFDIDVRPDFAVDGKLDVSKLEQYTRDTGDFPWHAWVLYKKRLAIGHDTQVDYTDAHNLKDVLTGISNKIKRNHDLHKHNNSFVATLVKKSYETQSGSWDADGFSDTESVMHADALNDLKESFEDAVGPTRTPQNSRVFDVVTKILDYGNVVKKQLASWYEQFLDVCRRAPVTFIVTAGVLLVSLFAGVCYFFSRKQEDKTTEDALKPEDFEVMEVDEGGNIKRVKRDKVDADVLANAAKRMSLQVQSDDREFKHLPYKKIYDRRVVESKYVLQGDDYSDNIVDVAFNNMYGLKIRSITGTLSLGHIVFLQNTDAIMPSHFERSIKTYITTGDITEESTVVMTGVTANYELLMPVKRFLSRIEKRDVDKDLCLLRFKEARAHRNILKFFASSTDFTALNRFDARLDTLAGHETTNRRTRFMPAKMVEGIDVTGAGATYRFAKAYEYYGYTRKGDCGGILSAINSSSLGEKRLLGMHIAGAADIGVGFSNVLTQEYLADFVTSKIVDTAYQSGDLAIAQAPIEGSFIGLVKEEKTHSINMASCLTRTPLYGAWGPLDRKPAKLRKFITSEGNEIDPMKEALKPYATPLLSYDHEEVKMAMYIAMKPLKELTVDFDRDVLTFEQAVAGVPHWSYKGIPRGTSPGYPYAMEGHKDKRKIFGGEGEYDFSSEAATKVKDNVENILLKAKSGERVEHVFIDFLKDELRSKEKVSTGKTRLISSSPLEYTIAFRMMFGAFCSAVQKTRILSGMAVGINPYTEWDLLSRKLQSKGSCTVAGDFKGFDSSEQPIVHWEILEYINGWYNDSQENQLAREVLWLEVVHSRHLTNVDCESRKYQWQKSLPSGHPATTIINSMYNMCLFVMVWTKIQGVSMRSKFHDYNYLVVYGDDNAINISPEVTDNFNQNTIAKVMSEYGMTYTSENKIDGDIADYRPIEEITFLKRGFRFEPYKDEYVAPLALDTVLYSVYWCKNKKLMRQIVADNVETLYCELSLHEESVWNQWFPIISGVVEEKLKLVPNEGDQRLPYLQKTANMELPWL